MQRKKLGTSLQTLSPAEAAFLQGATPIAALEERRPSLSLAPDPSPNRDPLDPPSLQAPIAVPTTEPQTRTPKTERKEKLEPKELIEITDVLIADSFKLPQSLHRRLLRASSERKLERVKPYTKQDIVAVALSEWLTKYGYAS